MLLVAPGIIVGLNLHTWWWFDAAILSCRTEKLNLLTIYLAITTF